MTKEYLFGGDKGWQGDFMYVYSPLVSSYPVFAEEGDCILNRYDQNLADYEYISIISKQGYSRAEVTARCDFDKYGAPLVVFGNDINAGIGKDGKPHMFYGVHFEVVAWEEGCNIWYLVPDPEDSRCPVKPTLLLGERFKVESGRPIELTVEVEQGRVKATVNGHVCPVVEHTEIPQSFHIGYTACEGINRLYSFKIRA